jgi:hypothetical protein
MKINVKDLKPNPFRKMDKYPIDRDKVDALKASIKETTFWDNLLARKKDGHFEIAYGHHRLEALRDLEIEEVDIPVRDLNDARMIKIMANENLEEWKTSPAVINETVQTAKEYLERELAKYEIWEDLRADKFIGPIFDSEPQFRSIKGQGVGRETILKFLGDPPWKEWMIEEALTTIKKADWKGSLNREATELFSTQRLAMAFRKGVEAYSIHKDEQYSIAEQMVKDELGYNQIKLRMEKYSGLKTWRDIKKRYSDLLIEIDEALVELGSDQFKKLKDLDHELHAELIKTFQSLTVQSLHFLETEVGKEKLQKIVIEFIKKEE